MKRWSGAFILFAACLLFLVINRHAYQGYFQDDELDNLSWAPMLKDASYLRGLIAPTFLPDNFRPAGHYYFHVLGNTAGLDFAPYIAVLHAMHLLNMVLLFFVGQRLGLKPWAAGIAAAIFGLSAAGFDAYWKPMYVFDVLCTTFCLASLLAYMYRRWVLSFLALWLAYKSKELAVMLPAVLFIYEYVFGERKWWRVAPYLLVSVSFGLQGLIGNTNKNNDYTFRFTSHALFKTIPFYDKHILIFRWGSALLLAAAVVARDRRVWLGVALMLLALFPLLFLPGRLYPAYVYLPSTGAALALGGLFSLVNPIWAAVLLLAWTPMQVRTFRRVEREKLVIDRDIRAYTTSLVAYAAAHPSYPPPIIYDGAPDNFHDWGVNAAVNLGWRHTNLKAIWHDFPEAANLRATQKVLYLKWENHELLINEEVPTAR